MPCPPRWRYASAVVLGVAVAAMCAIASDAAAGPRRIGSGLRTVAGRTAPLAHGTLSRLGVSLTGCTSCTVLIPAAVVAERGGNDSVETPEQDGLLESYGLHAAVIGQVPDGRAPRVGGRWQPDARAPGLSPGHQRIEEPFA